MTKEFEAINLKRRVPVLIMGNEAIMEMAAVPTAIATVTPEAQTFGQPPLEKIQVYAWLISRPQPTVRLLRESAEQRDSPTIRRFIRS
ncbi:hypothetical protein CCMA1212_007499 [Trichoderma ghanense]|uniref:Uncharacterized protein n=1 Tax=Trichoderma ghanense TaxID=65468 RepID=A0ABY2GZJ4_9HYPO